MIHANAYYRFSPRRFADESQSIETQRSLCRAYCEAHGYTIAGEYEDRAVSGAEEDRPGLWSAIADLKRGWVLVAHKADRLARDVYLHELIYRAVAKKRAKIELVAGTNNDDTPENKLLRSVLAAFSEYERKVISARTKAAALRLQADGIAVSAAAPYGKRPGPPREIIRRGQPALQRTWEDDPEEQAIIARIVSLYTSGMKLREIARQLDSEGAVCRGVRWRHIAVRRILEREKLYKVCKQSLTT